MWVGARAAIGGAVARKRGGQGAGERLTFQTYSDLLFIAGTLDEGRYIPKRQRREMASRLAQFAIERRPNERGRKQHPDTEKIVGVAHGLMLIHGVGQKVAVRAAIGEDGDAFDRVYRQLTKVLRDRRRTSIQLDDFAGAVERLPLSARGKIPR